MQGELRPSPFSHSKLDRENRGGEKLSVERVVRTQCGGCHAKQPLRIEIRSMEASRGKQRTRGKKETGQGVEADDDVSAGTGCSREESDGKEEERGQERSEQVLSRVRSRGERPG